MHSAISVAVGILLISGLLVEPQPARSQGPSGANSDPTYQALRNLTLSNEAVIVKDFVLKRDAGTFHTFTGHNCLGTK